MMTFYDKIIPKHGWEKYSEINLEYQNQIICLKNDSDGINSNTVTD